MVTVLVFVLIFVVALSLMSPVAQHSHAITFTLICGQLQDTSSPDSTNSGVSSRSMKRVSSVSRVSMSRTSSARSSLLLDSGSTRPTSLGGARAAGTRSKFVLGPLTFTSHCLQVGSSRFLVHRGYILN